MSFPAYPKYKESGVAWLGSVPSHWESSRIGARFTERRRKVSDVDYPPLSVTKNGIVPQLETAAKTDDNDNRKCVLAGDFVINSRSDRKGSSGLSLLEGSVSLINTVIEPDDTMHGPFVHHLLRSVAFQEEYYRFGKGIVADLWSTNYGEMKAIALAVPPLPEQQAIASFLDRETAKIDMLVAEQERLISLLKEKLQAVVWRTVRRGLNPDAPMKDSGIEWLGEVPAHWEVSRLDRLMKFSSGRAHEPFIDDDGEHIYVSARFVSTQGESRKYCTENFTPAKRGDVVMVMSDLPSGRALARAYEIPDDQSYAVNQRVCLLSAFKGNGRYFAFQLNRNPGLLRYDDGLNQTHLSNAAYCKLPLLSPPLHEQEQIAAFLTSEKLASEELEAAAIDAIQLLQERRAALISAAVTGKIDVRGLVASDNVVSINAARQGKVLPSLSGVIGAHAIVHLGKLGRMAVMKGGYLAEAHAGIAELGGRYLREAAGPYCRAIVEGMERGAQEDFGISATESDAEGGKVEYRVPSGFALPRDTLRYLVGTQRADRFLNLLALLKELRRNSVEAIATLYAAWNDLLAQSGAVDDDAIISEVLNEWHAEKADKFTRADLEHWLEWMRRNDVVPDGTAPRTDHQGKLL